MATIDHIEWYQVGVVGSRPVWASNNGLLLLTYTSPYCIVKAEDKAPSLYVKEKDLVLKYSRCILGCGAYTSHVGGGSPESSDWCCFPYLGSVSVSPSYVLCRGGWKLPVTYRDWKTGDNLEGDPSWYYASVVISGLRSVFPSDLDQEFTFREPTFFDRDGHDRETVHVAWKLPRLERTTAGEGIAGIYKTAKDGWSGTEEIEVGLPRWTEGGSKHVLSVDRKRCGPARLGDDGKWTIGKRETSSDLSEVRESVTFSDPDGEEDDIVWTYDKLVVGTFRKNAFIADVARVLI